MSNWQNLVQEKVSRRGFLRGLSVLGAGAAAKATIPAAILAAAAPALSVAAQGAAGVSFAPIGPGSDDDVIVPEGFSYQVVIKRGDVFTSDGKTFGDNADWTGWYPIDGLDGGSSTEEGLLVVNNEYLNPLLVTGYMGDGEKTVEQILAEKESVGFAVIHLRRENGQWTIVTDSDYPRRFDATVPIQFTGPVAGTEVVGGATEVIGTAGNCSGGYTPWMTALSCEENYQSYYGEDSVNEVDLANTYRWLDDPDNAQMPEHYGWVVEVDPYTGVAKKRTAMGRFRHENVALAIGASGKVVAYMGDDSRDECVYKFISDGTYDPNSRDANLDILETGTLYAANFGSGRWIPVVYEGNEERFAEPVAGYTIDSLEDVLTYTNVVARALGATRTDRPEDIEVHPETGDVYIAFTNNSNHGNFHGQIARIKEAGGDHESLEFQWDIFAVGGPQSGFSSPDNLIFDRNNNLWVVTDVSSGSLNAGIYEFMGNNALFLIPTSGDNAGQAYRFASGPVASEMTGPTFVGDGLFLSVQHPGEESASLEELSSHWPEGGDAQPRAGVVFIEGPFFS